MSTSDEKKAPPYTERLQKEHCICRQSSLPKLHYTLTATRSSSLHLNLLFVSASHCNYPQAIFLCIALYCIGIHCLYGNAFHCWYLQAFFLVTAVQLISMLFTVYSFALHCSFTVGICRQYSLSLQCIAQYCMHWNSLFVWQCFSLLVSAGNLPCMHCLFI